MPYVVAGYPDLDTSLEAALACIDAGADVPRGRAAVLRSTRRWCDASARVPHAALKAGATFDRVDRALQRIADARPRVPLVPMCYANQVIGGGDGREAANRLAEAGAAGIIVADLTPGRGPVPSSASPQRPDSPSCTSSRPTTPAGSAQAMIAEPVGRLPPTAFHSPASPVLERAFRRTSPAWFATSGPRRRSPSALELGVSKPAHVKALARAGADGVIVASALVDALGPDGRDIASLERNWFGAFVRPAVRSPPDRSGRPCEGRDTGCEVDR